MRKKNYVLLSFIPLLAACSSYTGVISQQYDGERIETDTAVLAAYEEKYEIDGDETVILGDALPEFFCREPLDFGDDEDYMHPLTEEPLTVGVDLPEGRYTIVKSEAFYCEVLNKKASKGQAIEHLISKLNIAQHEVMTIGDHPNDFDMIQFAGIGVAMGNAVDEIKEIADYITATNDENGVAQAIEKFAL